MGGAARRWEKTQTVEALPLSDILDGLGGRSVDLLKIDVEGFEHKVLVGAGKYLGTTIKNLVVEMHSGPLKTLGSSEEALRFSLAQSVYLHELVCGVSVWRLHR